MERRALRNEKYCQGRKSSRTNQPEKHPGSLALSVHAPAIIATLIFFSQCKILTQATELSGLGKEFPHSSFEWFDKGLSYVPSLSINFSVSYVDLQLYRDGEEVLHHALPWLKHQGGNYEPYGQHIFNSRR